MMSDGLTCIFNMSLTGSAVMILVMLLRVCMRQVPKRMICLLWLVPFIRLLLPVSIEAPFSLLPVNPHSFTEITVAERNVPVVSTGIEAIDIPVNLVLISRYTSQTPGEAEEVYTLYGGVEMVWAAGMLLFLTVNAVRYYNMKQRLADSVPGADGAYYSDLLTVPLVAGVLPPRVYLPAALLKDGNEKEREFVLAHERAHIARHDPFTKILAFSALSIHWFNPLVWAAFHCLCHDIEMACDEKVMEMLGTEQRKAYSLTLLHFGAGENFPLLPLAFGENHVKSRIKHILNYKQPAFWVSLCAGFVLIFAATVLLTNPEGTASVGIIGGADGPTSVFLAGKLGGERNEEEHSVIIGGADGPTAVFAAGKAGGGQPADPLDLDTVVNMPYGMAVELDYVCAGAISLHGSFGYLSFHLERDQNNTLHAVLKRAVSLSEIGPVQMQGDGYTEILGGENGAIILAQPYSPGEEGKRVYLYSETENTIKEADTDEFKEMLSEYTGQGILADAPVTEEELPPLLARLSGQYPAPVLYGPVEILEFDSEVYGFLASDGEELKDLWYGIWNKNMDQIQKIPLFE